MDFFCLPLPKGKEQQYKATAETFATVMKEQGMLQYCEALAADVPRGKVTDFYRAVNADDSQSPATEVAGMKKGDFDHAWLTRLSSQELRYERIK